MALACKVQRLYSIGDRRSETVRRHVNPAEFLEGSLVRRRPFAVGGCRGAGDGDIKIDAVRQNLFFVADRPPDGEAREIPVGLIDPVVVERHGDEDFIIAGVRHDTQAFIFGRRIVRLHHLPLWLHASHAGALAQEGRHDLAGRAIRVHPARRHKGHHKRSSSAILRRGLSWKFLATRLAVGVARW